jgi:hypothetical protein
MKKAPIWRAFLIQRRIFSEPRNAWLEREDSNPYIPDREMPFEISGEFRLFSLKWGLETFAAGS